MGQTIRSRGYLALARLLSGMLINTLTSIHRANSEGSTSMERYAKLPILILLHGADLRPPRSSILKSEGFA